MLCHNIQMKAIFIAFSLCMVATAHAQTLTVEQLRKMVHPDSIAHLPALLKSLGFQPY